MEEARQKLTVEERVARDGPRWRYILGLENELEMRSRLFSYAMAFNGALIGALVGLWLGYK